MTLKVTPATPRVNRVAAHWTGGTDGVWVRLPFFLHIFTDFRVVRTE